MGTIGTFAFAEVVSAPLDDLVLANDIVIQNNFISSLAYKKVEPKDVKTLISEYQIKYGLVGFYETALCESGFNASAIGDSGGSYGLWQIHLPAWPEITKEQALDPVWSTQWAVEKFQEDPTIWTCYNLWKKKEKI